jgi:hypothetical protein
MTADGALPARATSVASRWHRSRAEPCYARVRGPGGFGYFMRFRCSTFTPVTPRIGLGDWRSRVRISAPRSSLA